MTGSEFLSAMAGKSIGTWEAHAVELAQEGELVDWPWIEVPVGDALGNTGILYVASDVVSVGDTSNYLRLPLRPLAAQQIADVLDAILPTRKTAFDIFKTATSKLDPQNLWPNVGGSLKQYSDHNGIVQEQMRARDFDLESLVTGHKKDVVLSRNTPKGNEVIFGWFDARGSNANSTNRMPDGTRYIQDFNPTGHDLNWVDYSHGIRMIRQNMLANGQPARVEDVLRDPDLWSLVSDEGGPYKTVRYPAPVISSAAVPQANVGVYKRGVVRELSMAKGLKGA